MILSVSRRTDIPNYYSDWFYNRIKDGYLYVRNPMYPNKVSKINISPEVIDCIVFWTKNPEPMIARLNELKDYQYYFQFTLTGYGKDIEANLPDKKKMIPIFQKLSSKIGSDRVIWRYDPIFFNERYTEEYHLKAFRQIAESLKGYTPKCVISFVDVYAKNEKNMEHLHIEEDNEEKIRNFTKKICEIAKENEITVASCAESIDLEDCGVVHNSCIDKELIESLIGYSLKGGKDKNQRKVCGCMESIDIGTYDTCLNGCKYCYANISHEKAIENYKKYDKNSPFLCSHPMPDDIITERKMYSLKKGK